MEIKTVKLINHDELVFEFLEQTATIIRMKGVRVIKRVGFSNPITGMMSEVQNVLTPWMSSGDNEVEIKKSMVVCLSTPDDQMKKQYVDSIKEPYGGKTVGDLFSELFGMEVGDDVEVEEVEEVEEIDDEEWPEEDDERPGEKFIPKPDDKMAKEDLLRNILFIQTYMDAYKEIYRKKSKDLDDQIKKSVDKNKNLPSEEDFGDYGLYDNRY